MVSATNERFRAMYVKENPQVIYNTSKLLLAQMNDILDNRLLDRKGYECQNSACDLKELVQETVKIFEAQARLCELTFDCRLPTTDVVVLTDGVRVQQVLINLFSNAIKFSPRKSHIVVELNLEEVQKPPDTVNDDEDKEGEHVYVKWSLSVRDYGIGMNEQDQKNLFKPFFKTTD